MIAASRIAAAAIALLLAGLFAPVAAQTVDADWDQLRSRWDPADDDAGILVGLAGVAADARDLPRFHAFLDSVVGAGDAGPNALRYWGAVGLQLGAHPDSVATRLATSIDSQTSVGTLAEFVGLLEANEAVDPALRLLDAAAAAGTPASRVALVRGQLLAVTGDREGAIDAWLLAIGSGGEDAVGAAARLGDLAAEGFGVPEGTVERIASLREVAEGEAAAAVAMLAVRVHTAEGRWSEAREAAADPALEGAPRGEALRQIARLAIAADALEPAREALRELVALGPPAARAEDRMTLGAVEHNLGNPSAAAASFEQARIGGASGARSREIAAELEAARASGDPEAIARAVEDARAAGADPMILAVPLGDLLLSRSFPDSALSAYASGIDEGPVGPGELESLARVRLVQALGQSGSPADVAAGIGDALVRAPGNPAAAAIRLVDLAAAVGSADTLDVARSLVLALAAEWRGRSGDAAGASADLERAAAEAKSAGEIPALLLAAGRWAEAAGDTERARQLWRTVVQDHASTPYALDARRRLAEGG